MTKMLPLTKSLEVSNKAHIFYLLEREEVYIDNLLAYIKLGIENGHHIIIIEDYYIFNKVWKEITQQYTLEQQKNIHHMDNIFFYNYYEDFHIQSIVDRFSELIQNFLNDNITVRTWARVVWKDQENIEKKIEEFEIIADASVIEMSLMSVCAYHASQISASLQTTLMRSHEYLMTDKEFFRSPLYYGTTDTNT